jgi:hypothetical protein
VTQAKVKVCLAINQSPRPRLAEHERSDLVALGHEVKPSKQRTLNGAGITKEQASDWERLSEVPADQFEAALATRSVHDLIAKPTPVSDDALLFIARDKLPSLHNFFYGQVYAAKNGRAFAPSHSLRSGHMITNPVLLNLYSYIIK